MTLSKLHPQRFTTRTNKRKKEKMKERKKEKRKSRLSNHETHVVPVRTPELSSIDTKLEEEKEELNKYQNLDKQRRALEYTLYDMDFRSVGERLEQIKELRVEESTKANALHQKLTKSESEIEIVDQELLLATYDGRYVG